MIYVVIAVDSKSFEALFVVSKLQLPLLLLTIPFEV